jgi:chromosome segregation protein
VGDAVLVSDLAAALALHREHPAVDYLTLEGDVVWASGVVTTGGRQESDRGLLAHQRRIHEARKDRSEASGLGSRVQERAEAAAVAVARLEQEVETQRTTAEEAERRRLELELRSQRSTDDRERTGRRSEVLAAELLALEEQIAADTANLKRLQTEVESAEREHHTVEAALAERSRTEGERERRRREQQEQLASLRADQAGMVERQEAREQEARRLGESAAELAARIETLATESRAAGERVASTTELREETEKALLAHLAERAGLQTRCAEMERSIAEQGRGVHEQDRELRVARDELDTRREATRGAELQRTKSESARSHLDELCLQELGSTADEAGRLAAEAGHELESVDFEALEAEVEDLRARVEKIGPVNMTAIEEFSELEERLAFLSAQRDDLDTSMTSLRETIRRIDRSSRDRFIHAFEAIRKSYQEIFALLFNGGRADLRLEEGDDVLECGIEIMVQPPGKRLGNIQLMSGGEKAMSAIALLFAVFRFQPSPFCLLDEVDAALDDANVGRFARMITEYAKQTQFILITHNKLSMESADLLYGVTMEEAGVSRLVSMQLQ